jgi:DHA1 family tetracycline resistance protein-like MFS transporter
VILISCFGLAIDYVIMATAPNLAWLFVGRTLSGITSASMVAANAYIADITPPQERAGAYGLLSAAFGVGFILGPMLGGLLGQVDPRLPFWAAAGLTALNGAYGLFVLPESLAPENRAPFSLHLANPFAALGFLGSSPQLLGLSFINFMTRLVHAVFAVVWALYVSDRTDGYRWGPLMIGVSMGVVGVASLIVSAGLVRPTVKRLGERRTLVASLLFAAAGFALMGWSRQGWEFLASIFVLCLWGLSGPALQSLMTRLVSPSEQGRLQGATTGLTSIAGLIGPALFAAAMGFASTPASRAQGLFGLPFYLAAALMVVAVAAAWRVTASQVEAAQPAE